MNISKKERLLRAAGLIIILRDELEELDKYNSWIEVANKYLDELIKNDDESNKQYERIFTHIHRCISTVESPDNLINELIFILEKDMRRTKMTTEVAKELYAETLAIKSIANVSKVKLLDSKIRLV
jgi:hypothetical protein